MGRALEAGGPPSSNGPTAKSWRTLHHMSDKLTYLAGEKIDCCNASNGAKVTTGGGVFEFERAKGQGRFFKQVVQQEAG